MPHRFTNHLTSSQKEKKLFFRKKKANLHIKKRLQGLAKAVTTAGYGEVT